MLVYQGLEARDKVPLALIPVDKFISQEVKSCKRKERKKEREKERKRERERERERKQNK